MGHPPTGPGALQLPQSRSSGVTGMIANVSSKRGTLAQRRIADAVPLTALGFGAAVLGNLYAEVSDAVADAAIEVALESGIRYFDTAPHYGYGLSESRLGRALAARSATGAVLSTKVGRLIVPTANDGVQSDGFAVTGRRSVFDYSRDGILRSFESSLRRLRRQRVEVLLLHDVGQMTHGRHHESMLRQALEEALPTMRRLKEMGSCLAVGIGVNESAVCMELMGRCDLDCILLAGRYTLLEQQTINTVMAEAHRRKIAVIIGGAFNSGLLAGATEPGTTYNYGPADVETGERARRMYAICSSLNVDVGAAALQFVLAHPAVVSVIPGLRSPDEVRTAVQRVHAQIPGRLWQELRAAGLLLPDSPTP